MPNIPLQNVETIHTRQPVQKRNIERQRTPETVEKGKSFQLIETTRGFYSQLTNDINSAQKSVDLLFFTFEMGKETKSIFEAVERAARRGTNVRILLDHWTTLYPSVISASYSAYQKLRSLQREGLPLEIRFSKQTKESKNPLRRNHKKTVIVDSGTQNEFGYVGGVNISPRHANWNDFMVRVEGEVTNMLEDDFENTWNNKNANFSRYISSDRESEVLSDSRSTHGIEDRILHDISNAKERIWVQTAFLDSGPIGKALIEAKKINPKIDIVVITPHPKTSPDFLYRFFPKHYIKPLLQVGIRVYEYGEKSGRFNHAKALLIDDSVMIGSSNYNTSLRAGGNAEIALITKNQLFLSVIEQRFNQDTEQSAISTRL